VHFSRPLWNSIKRLRAGEQTGEAEGESETLRVKVAAAVSLLQNEVQFDLSLAR